MIIKNELCNKCGRCIAECPKAAISKDNAGNYKINAELCNNCEYMFDVECVRVCKPNAITLNNGLPMEYDRTWRLRSEHLIWLMAVMGSRGNGAFPAGNLEWDNFRKLISAAFVNPDLKVRLTKNFDDICIGCHKKQIPGHPEGCGDADDVCFRRLGVKPGTVMKLWDVVQLVEDTYSLPFVASYPDYVLNNFLAFVSPQAKLRSNTDQPLKDNEYLDNLEKKLTTAVICDILDDLGFRNQAMSGSLFPLDDSYKLVGFAKTILAYDVFEIPDKPYVTEIEAVDSVKPGEVCVVCTNSSSSNGFWGELMATATVARGGRGAIVDGSIRDITQLKQMSGQFKVFATGRNPLDSKGRCLVSAYDCPIKCGNVQVNSGDLVFGDIDGVVVIPKAHIDEVIEKALHKISGENTVRGELRKGRLLKDVFEQYGIL